MRSIARRVAVLVATVMLLPACGGDGPTAPPAPGITIVAQPTGPDTVLTQPLQALVVEVHAPHGEPVSGAVIRFEAQRTTTARGEPTYGAFVCRVTASECFTPIVADTLDARGRAVVAVRYGSVAGEQTIRVHVPEFGFEHEVTFTVTPGAIGAVTLAPADTAVAPGGSFDYRATVTDRYGNARDGAVTYRLGSGAAAVESDGGFRATGDGRMAVVGTAGEMADTAFVSVRPAGRIAAVRGGFRIVVMDLGGANRQEYATATFDGGIAGLSWSADGSRLAFGGSDYGASSLRVLDLATGQTSTLVTPSGSVTAVWWARYARAGGWLFFSGQRADGWWSLFRARADGTGVEPVGPEPMSGAADWRGGPNADGSKVAYVTNRTGSVTIRVVDVATGTVESIDVSGQTPRFSPDGTVIAYVDNGGGALHVMNADGTNRRTLSAVGMSFGEGSFDWSPDGQRLIASSDVGLQLVDVATGGMVPIPNTAGFMLPAWSP